MKVYKITNTINDKAYIGITNGDIETRFKQHARQGYHLHSEMKRLGQENFTITTIANALSTNDLSELEKELIEEHNTKHPNGYNTTSGRGPMIGKNKKTEYMREYRKKVNSRHDHPQLRTCTTCGNEFAKYKQFDKYCSQDCRPGNHQKRNSKLSPKGQGPYNSIYS